jgi:hypothetical protein
MPARLIEAYGLIALMILGAAIGLVILVRRVRERRRIGRGGRPRKR